MSGLIALRLTPLLPSDWPQWSGYAFMAIIVLFSVIITIAKKRIGYYLSGFLVGSVLLVEYFEPGVLTLPLLPFLVGGVIGSLLVGIFTEWALVILSCLVGAYFLTGMFLLSDRAALLVGAGLFVIGAITRAILMRMQEKD